MFRANEWLIGQQMNKELIRLSSFRSYPNFEVFPIKLAKAGFVYEENGDEVKCFECGITYKHWTKGDDPIEIHVRLSPECRFLTREVNIKNMRRNNIIVIKNHRRILNESTESLLTSHPMITKQNVLVRNEIKCSQTDALTKVHEATPTLSSTQRSSIPIEQHGPDMHVSGTSPSSVILNLNNVIRPKSNPSMQSIKFYNPTDLKSERSDKKGCSKQGKYNGLNPREYNIHRARCARTRRAAGMLYLPRMTSLPLRTDGRQLTEKTAAKLGYWKDGSMKDPDVSLIAPVFNSSQQKVNVSGDKKEIPVRLSSSDRGEAANVLINEGTTSQICTNDERLGEFTLVVKLSWRK